MWAEGCMIIAVRISKEHATPPAFSNKFDYAKASISIALLIWLMIYLDISSCWNDRRIKYLLIALFETALLLLSYNRRSVNGGTS